MCHLQYFVCANQFLDDCIHKWAFSHLINIWLTKLCGVHASGLYISALSLNCTCLCQTSTRARAIGHSSVASVLTCSFAQELVSVHLFLHLDLSSLNT